MPANTYGRQVIIPMTNKSGGAVAAGDVVIVDTTNNLSFTTTTSAGFTGMVGVAQGTIASNAIGLVLLSGYAALVNVNASVTRGHYGATHTVAKQAAGQAARGAGTFCQFLTGGTTPDAAVYPADLAGAALTDPTTTRGDIITRGAAVIQRLALGAVGKVLVSDGTDVVWGGFHGCRANNTAGTTINHATPTAVPFAAADTFDTDAYHDTSTANTKIIVPSTVPGYYEFTGQLAYTAIASGNGSYALIRKNGTTDLAEIGRWTEATNVPFFNVSSGPIAMVATDYVELIVNQNSGSSKTLETTSGYNWLAAKFLGAA